MVEELKPKSPNRATTVARTFLPPLAVATFAIVNATILSSAGATLGYDFQAYYRAAERVVSGQPLYELTATALAGPFGLFLYPPPFVLAILPLTLLSVPTATLVWIGLLLAAFLVGVAIMPVSRDVRWVILLLAGLSWPFAYAIKLGQVGPLLFFLFAVGWRSVDRPRQLGISIAIGTMIKIQPALLLVWAAGTGRLRAVAIGLVVIIGLALLGTVVLGPQTWLDLLSVVARVNAPITTPHNFAPGAVAYQLGVPDGPSQAFQVAAVVVSLGVVAVSILLARPDVSYLTAVTASQLISPVLWDHYAMLLLLTVAYLIHRGHWWAALIPLSTSIPLVGITPPWIYPLAFGIALLGPVATEQSGAGTRRRVFRA